MSVHGGYKKLITLCITVTVCYCLLYRHNNSYYYDFRCGIVLRHILVISGLIGKAHVLKRNNRMFIIKLVLLVSICTMRIHEVYGK